jgi:membrane protease YdiL (CAAX protease family)
MQKIRYGLWLPFRLVAFIAFQLAIALVLVVAGVPSAWRESQGLWIISGLLTNLVTGFALARLLKAEGRTYSDLLKVDWKSLRRDAGKLSASAAIILVLASVPNLLLALALYGSMDGPARLMFRELPALVIALGFPWAIAQGMLELPFYFYCLMPRVGKDQGNWVGYALSCFFLALQHVGMPLILDWKFMLWRFGMFLLFAFFAGLVIKKKPAFMPPLMLLHALLDLSTIMMFFTGR